MSFLEEIESSVSDIFNSQWSYKDGQVVPKTKGIGLGNDGTNIEATVLYADLDESTSLVDTQPAEFCAEVYKAFLKISTNVIRKEGGEVRSFDGDRVMGVFLGGSKNNAAARAGLKINYCVRNILNPALSRVYSNCPAIKHTVGIDTSDLLAIRSGIRGTNDLVWIGRAANHAAKLNGLSSNYPTRITKQVFDRLHEDSKYGGDPRRLMWEEVNWTSTGRTIHRTKWTWKP